MLAIDQGTSATKAMVVAVDRRVLAPARVSVATVTGVDGSEEQHSQAL
ncbi:MAG TPA: hypothetical protein VMW47_08070 [Verrucomicrobiae bacterium]|nr:hypothetical protein [Verrucomicrobiae bacterium]